MKTDRDKHIQEKLEKLLSAYLDGELSTSKLQDVAKQLRNGDNQLRQELATLQSVRQAVRGYYKDQYVDSSGSARNLSLWSRLAEEVAVIASNRETRSPHWSLWRGSSAIWLKSLLRPPVLAGMTAVCALMVYTLASGPDSLNPQSDIATWQGPAAEPPLEFARHSGQSLPTSVANVSLRQPVMPLSMPDAMTATYRRQAVPQNGAPVYVRSLSRMMDKEFVLGGVRANGMDIDWIQSDKKFKIYLTDDSHTPPIIWVAHPRHSISQASLPSDYEN